MMTSSQPDVVFGGTNNFGLSFQIVSDKGAAKGRDKGSFAWGGFFGTTYWADQRSFGMSYNDTTNAQQP